jgi:hypothetical protein
MGRPGADELFKHRIHNGDKRSLPGVQSERRGNGAKVKAMYHLQKAKYIAFNDEKLFRCVEAFIRCSQTFRIPFSIAERKGGPSNVI